MNQGMDGKSADAIEKLMQKGFDVLTQSMTFLTVLAVLSIAINYVYETDENGAFVNDGFLCRKMRILVFICSFFALILTFHYFAWLEFISYKSLFASKLKAVFFCLSGIVVFFIHSMMFLHAYSLWQKEEKIDIPGRW